MDTRRIIFQTSDRHLDSNYFFLPLNFSSPRRGKIFLPHCKSKLHRLLKPLTLPLRGLLSSLPKTRTFIFNAERLHETRIDTNSLGISSNFSALEERIGKKKQGGGKKCFAETGFSLDPLFFIRAAHFFTRLARNGFRHDKNSRASNCCPSLSPVQFLQTHACFALFPEISLDYSIKLRSARSKNSSG